MASDQTAKHGLIDLVSARNLAANAEHHRQRAGNTRKQHFRHPYPQVDSSLSVFAALRSPHPRVTNDRKE
jgi:hypothetical protein